jgi:hypothetical protein
MERNVACGIAASFTPMASDYTSAAVDVGSQANDHATGYFTSRDARRA